MSNSRETQAANKAQAFYTRDEIAQKWGVCTRTVKRWVEEAQKNQIATSIKPRKRISRASLREIEAHLGISDE